MYDKLTCGNCGFNPKKQEQSKPNDSEFKSYHWETTYNLEYFPSEDSLKRWEEVSCPICGTKVYSTL